MLITTLGSLLQVAFKIVYFSSLNLIGHVHIPRRFSELCQSGQTQLPRDGDAIHPALPERCEGSGLVHKTKKGC